MIINLSNINKEVLIDCLKEENERDEWMRRTLARQIEDNQTYGKSEEFKKSLERYNNKKDYFDCLINIIPNTDIIEEFDNEELIQFWKDLIKNQIYISNSRIEDWSENGIMYESFRKRDLDNLDNFEEACQKIRNMDIEEINCMKQIYLMINYKEYDYKNW